jgi:hypothetical protein
MVMKKMSSAPMNEGQMAALGAGYSTQVGQPIPEVGDLSDLQSLQGEALDRPGFETNGYITKKGTAYGEAAKFNYLPPGMDIDCQMNYSGVHSSFTYHEIVNGDGFDGWNIKN